MAKPSLAVIIGMGRGTKKDNINPTSIKDGTKADGWDGGGEEGREPAEDGKDKEQDDESEDPHLDAAHEVLDAVKAGDAEALSDALKVFYDLCKEESAEGEEY